MPGSPAAFTDKTIVLVYGNGGIGKSTFLFFLQEHPSILSIELDLFFKHDFVLRNQSDSTCIFRKWILSLDRPNLTIDIHTKTLLKNPDLLRAFLKFLLSYIETQFLESNPSIICLGGFSLQFEPLLGQLLNELKVRRYRVWKCHP